MNFPQYQHPQTVVPAFWETRGSSTRPAADNLFRTFKSTEDVLSHEDEYWHEYSRPLSGGLEYSPHFPYTDPHAETHTQMQQQYQQYHYHSSVHQNHMLDEHHYLRQQEEEEAEQHQHQHHQHHQQLQQQQQQLQQQQLLLLQQSHAQPHFTLPSTPLLSHDITDLLDLPPAKLKRNWSAEDVALPRNSRPRLPSFLSSSSTTSSDMMAAGAAAVVNDVSTAHYHTKENAALPALSALPAAIKYPCVECGKSFQRPSSLATHMNIHTGDKPHVCPFPNCGRHFNARSNMVRHHRLHFRTSPSTDASTDASTGASTTTALVENAGHSTVTA
ncbi:LAFA_0D04016g1_1 [Lachancea sp. 'fantastica']|nr:LAFA_0D04016g1_1 [Lachancea sp. 'fantastica']